MAHPTTRIAAGLFLSAATLGIVGIAAQSVHDSMPKPTLVKRESRVAYTSKPPKQEATIAAVQVIAATPTPEPTPEPTIMPTPEPTPVPTPWPTAVYVAPAPPTGTHQEWMAAAGIAESDWQYVDFIVKAESGWRVTVSNPSSGSYGLCQSLPANKMASAGSDYLSNPITQLKWCHGYALQRYGSWFQAKSFWDSHRWW